MFYFKRCINSSFSVYKLLARTRTFSSSSFELTLKNTFSPEDHTKILQILNQGAPEVLSRYKISNGKIKNITQRIKKKGPFQSLNDILEVEGLGEKVSVEIFKNIAYDKVCEVKPKSPKTNKLIRNILIPEISENLSNSLETAIAIHLDPTGIGWIKLNKKDNAIMEWKCENLSSLPKKMLPTEIFVLALDIIKLTPCGDIYIFEAPSTLSPQSQTKQSLVAIHNQQMELLSMLLALLNTSTKHNSDLQTPCSEVYTGQNVPNKVFYVRNKLPARLFNTLIGYEKVSAIPAVTGLLNEDPSILELCPCNCITADLHLKQDYFKQSAINKELLAQALMLGVSFMDLCIHKKLEAYESLKPNRQKKTGFVAPNNLS